MLGNFIGNLGNYMRTFGIMHKGFRTMGWTMNPLVENIAKKIRSRFSIVVLLTTMICSH